MRATRIARRGFCSVVISAAMLIGPGLLGATQVARAATVHALVTQRALAAPTCNTVTPAMIKKALGIVVGAPRRSGSGKAFLCEYASAKSSLAVVIQYNLVGSDSNYKTLRAGFEGNSEPTTPLRSLGSLANEAFTASLGTGALAQHSVVALQKKLEVDIATSASLPKIVVLMRQILTIS